MVLGWSSMDTLSLSTGSLLAHAPGWAALLEHLADLSTSFLLASASCPPGIELHLQVAWCLLMRIQVGWSSKIGGIPRWASDTWTTTVGRKVLSQEGTGPFISHKELSLELWFCH
jgi:hypothetical protein